MISERAERFFDDWDGWSLLLVAAGSLLCLVVLIPAMSIGLGDETSRFFVLVLAMTAISAACIHLSLPRKSIDMDYLVVGPSFKGTVVEDVQDRNIQIDLCKSLQSAFIVRVMGQRGIGMTDWIGLDEKELGDIVKDPDLVDLLTGHIISDEKGIIGKNFPIYFDVLLRKVEDWR